MTLLDPPSVAAHVPPPPQWAERAPNQSLPTPKRKRGRREKIGLALRFGLAAAGIAISFSIDGGIFGPVVALFLILLPFEKLYPRQKGQPIRRPMLTTDISFALMGPVLNVATIVAVVIIGGLSLFWLPGLLFRPLVAMLPGWALILTAFVMFDFLAYWAHRWAHEVPFLWRFHAVHHSPEHMDWISGFRVHPFDGVLIAPPAFFLLGAGVDGQITGVLAILQIVLGIFFHANVRVRWRFLDKKLASPEFHHWHHANEADSIGHNYAPTLPQWDMMFGTYFMPSRESDRRPSHYGVDEYIPRHLFGLLMYPLRGARKHISLLWHPIRAVKTAARGTRNILRDTRTSTTRKTHAVRRATTTGCSSTNDSLFDSLSQRPGWDPAVPDEPILADHAPMAWSSHDGVIEF